MTPKEKAREICSKMAGDSDYKEMKLVSKYAIIAVDEIILSIINIHNGMTWSERKQTIERNTGYSFWSKVKQEIEKL